MIIAQSYCSLYAPMTSIPSAMHDVYGDHSEQICCISSYAAETLSFRRSQLEHS